MLGQIFVSDYPHALQTLFCIYFKNNVLSTRSAHFYSLNGNIMLNKMKTKNILEKLNKYTYYV